MSNEDKAGDRPTMMSWWERWPAYACAIAYGIASPALGAIPLWVLMVASLQANVARRAMRPCPLLLIAATAVAALSSATLAGAISSHYALKASSVGFPPWAATLVGHAWAMIWPMLLAVGTLVAWQATEIARHNRKTATPSTRPDAGA